MERKAIPIPSHIQECLSPHQILGLVDDLVSMVWIPYVFRSLDEHVVENLFLQLLLAVISGHLGVVQGDHRQTIQDHGRKKLVVAKLASAPMRKVNLQASLPTMAIMPPSTQSKTPSQELLGHDQLLGRCAPSPLDCCMGNRTPTGFFPGIPG